MERTLGDRERRVGEPPEAALTRIDWGLLVLRGAGCFLVATFGWSKVRDLVAEIARGVPLNQAGLAPLIHGMGFPFAGLLAVYVTLCESLAAVLVASGLWTRAAAACLAVSMTGAFFYSARVGEEPLRALLYLTVFAALALTGPGKLSIDHRWITASSKALAP